MALDRLVNEEEMQYLRGRLIQVLYTMKDRRVKGHRFKHSARFLASFLGECGFGYTEGQVRRQLAFLEAAGYVESELADRSGPFADAEVWCLSELAVKLHDGEVRADRRIEFDRDALES